MKKQILPFFCSLILLLSLFSGCNTQNAPTPTEPAVPIALVEQIPSAAVGVSYELSSLVIEEDGITYDYTATYVDPESGETKDLKVTKDKIKPKAETDISVTITATQNGETSSVTVTVPISISADIVDKMLSTDGIAGQAGDGVSKVITKDSAYLQGENSTSAIAATFSGNGTHLLTLSHYALQPYYSAQVWQNAAVTFWVYNPAETDVNFKLAYQDSDIAMLWDSPENTQTQTAKAGQWTKLLFSLYNMGITEPHFDSATHQNDKYLHLLASYAGEGQCTLYIDGVDVVNAETVEDLTTGYTESPVPAGDYSNLLRSCKVYTNETLAKLAKGAKSNGGSHAYSFSATQPTGHPTFYLDFPEVTDISGFDYLKFDILSENAYPFVTAAIRYVDENGEIQKHGIGYDYYANNEWQTIYLNLDYAHYADLTKAVGICFSVHMDSQFRTGQINTVYFDNVSLYEHPEKEPQLPPAVQEDHDLISGPLYVLNTKPNINGVCKVSADEAGSVRSNSTLMFWTNNACGYPAVEAHFSFDTPQDWSNYSILSFDTHQSHGHYWLQFQIQFIDEYGDTQTAVWYYDTIATNWQTNHASLDWFKTSNGEVVTPDQLTQVTEFKIAVNMAINVTAEIALIFFDNFEFS